MDLLLKQKRDNMLAVCSSILNLSFDPMKMLHLRCMIDCYKKAMSGASNKLNQCSLLAYAVITQNSLLMQYFV